MSDAALRSKFVADVAETIRSLSAEERSELDALLRPPPPAPEKPRRGLWIGDTDVMALAHQIRSLDSGGRAVLAMELDRIAAEAGPRCPARNLRHEGGAQCVREEGHTAPHVGADGAEWLVALRCRVGAIGGLPTCDRIEGHEGACVPRPAPSPLPAPAPGTRELRARGICQCGKGRQEHGGPMHTKGVQGTDCKKYRP